VKIEVDAVEFQFSRLDFGEIQDVVDHIQEGFARFANGIGVASLPLAQRRPHTNTG
jgi:hypothetical protein